MIIGRDREILYVGSILEQRQAVRVLLESVGYTVVEKSSPADVLTLLNSAAFDTSHAGVQAVILDAAVQDPLTDDLCRQIKSSPRTRKLPIIQIASTSLEAEPTSSTPEQSWKADVYLKQPVSPSELLSLIDALTRVHQAEETLHFQADVTARLTSSLDYEETLHTLRTVFVPDFADECFVHLNSLMDASVPAGIRVADGSLQQHHPELQNLIVEVGRTGRSNYVDSSTIIVPLEVGRRHLGSLVYRLTDDKRRYTPDTVALAEDLADRAALALQNAELFTSQQTAQAALVQSEKLAAAGRLSAAIAHEINNPLESITNLIFLIDTSEEITPTLKAYAEEALSELSRLTHIARQSLGFYRELTGPASFDFNESIEDTLNIYLKRFEAKHIEIVRSYTPGLFLYAVKGEIRQVISNLLVNAYDALPSYGSLRVETAELGEYVCLRILDNGSGIPHEVLPRVFEPFYTTKEDTGTGLGLWVSKNIVHKHGGQIEVESRTEGDHRGTSFTVTIPRTLRQAA